MSHLSSEDKEKLKRAIDRNDLHTARQIIDGASSHIPSTQLRATEQSRLDACLRACDAKLEEIHRSLDTALGQLSTFRCAFVQTSIAAYQRQLDVFVMDLQTYIEKDLDALEIGAYEDLRQRRKQKIQDMQRTQRAIDDFRKSFSVFAVLLVCNNGDFCRFFSFSCEHRNAAPSTSRPTSILLSSREIKDVRIEA